MYGVAPVSSEVPAIIISLSDKPTYLDHDRNQSTHDNGLVLSDNHDHEVPHRSTSGCSPSPEVLALSRRHLAHTRMTKNPKKTRNPDNGSVTNRRGRIVKEGCLVGREDASVHLPLQLSTSQLNV